MSAPVLPKRRVDMAVSVSARDLVDGILDSLTNDELFALITHLDEQVQDWGFTIRLIEHFEALRPDYDREVNGNES